MFKNLRDALKTSKDTWNFAGYWAEVIVEYGNLTGWNLEQAAKSSGDQNLLDHFCRKAMDKGLSAKSCAHVIYEKGFHDAGVLDGPPDAAE